MLRRLLLSLLLLFALGAGAQHSVRYRTESTVYITAGTAAGVAVGDRFEVLRGGKVIGTIEVIFAAEQSASAKVISETSSIQAADAVRRIGTPATPPPAPPAPVIAATAGSRDWAPSISGNVSLDAETNQRDSNRTLARASLRARRIAGLPLHLRTRVRLASEESRLYELSLLYEPFGGRVAVQAGRLGNSPMIGLGYLDGILGRVRIIEGVETGAFFGYRPDVTELTLDTSTTKYGAFVRVNPVPMAELTLTGVRMQNDADESTFVALDGRYAPHERLSLFAHGRFGISDTVDDERGADTILTALAQVTQKTTLSVSYERVQPGIDDDLRTTDQVINDYLRQGFRATLRHPNFFIGGGIRTGDDDVEDNDTISATAGVSHPNLLGVNAGLSATAYSSPINDGVFVNARFGRRFGAGHLAELTAGALLVDESALDDLSTTTWIRAGLWLELPGDLFARGELEVTGGDPPAGHRVMLGAGYRF